jgi:Ca2+-binding EF-hand superfamily protein
MLKSLCSGGFSAQEYFASQGIDGSQLAPRKAFVAMLRNLLPVNDKEIAAILTRYGESGAVDTKTFFADAGLSPSFQASAESHSDDISSSVLHQLRRQIVSNSKGPEHVMRLFATYDRLGTGAATTVQFVRVLRRVQITLPESDEDAITQALDGSQTGKIDYLSFVRFCFEDKGAKLSSSGSKSPAAHKPGRPQSALVTRPVLLEEGGSGVREVVRPNRPSSSTARLNSSLRRRSSDSAYDDYRHEVFDDDQALHPAPRSPLMAHLDEYSDIQEDGGSVASNISLVASNTIDNSSYRSVVPPDRSSSSASSVTSSLQWYTDPLLQDPSKDADITAPYLLRLRELVVRRHQQGRSLREIFHHFDRAKSGYFGAAELRRGMNDLKLNVNADLVPAVLRSIAMDGADRASLGEFTAFMSGCDFKAVEGRVVECVSRHVRGAGLAFLQRFLDAMGASYTSPELFPPLSDAGHGMDRFTFIETLRRLGLTLQKDDVDSLCTRFDLHASGVISVARFLKMVQASTGFVEAERGAMEQEEVCQQAAQAKRVLRAKASTGQTFLTLDIIQMAEYLGIKCISEPQLLWIAKQCLQAPLPPNWSSRIDNSGSTVYCNSATRKAQAEHPLDPHFKALRDAYRAR